MLFNEIETQAFKFLISLFFFNLIQLLYLPVSKDYMPMVVSSTMTRQKELTMNEKSYITRKISKGKSSLQISKDLNRDHRPIKKTCQRCIKLRKKEQAGFKKLTKRDLSHIYREVINKLSTSSGSVF